MEILDGRFAGFSNSSAGMTVSLSTAMYPVALSTFLIGIGWMITLPLSQKFDQTSDWFAAIQPVSSPVTLAFLGAYFFSLQMLFRRYVLRDLGGTAYVAVSMRIILAVIGIWTLMVIGKDSGISNTYLLVVAFIFGVFPRVIWQIIESLFKKAAGFAVPSMTSELPVSDLDGLTVWHEARLQEEDIENIPNMADADLVELFLNTRFPPERIIDWMDQAILYTQLGPQGEKPEKGTRNKLRLHGIRTATSLLQALTKEESRKTVERLLEEEEGVNALPTLQSSLIINANLRLIQRWRDMLMPQGPPSRITSEDSRQLPAAA